MHLIQYIYKSVLLKDIALDSYLSHHTHYYLFFNLFDISKMLVSFSLLILGFGATTQLALASPARDRVRYLSPAELDAFENPPADAGMLPEYGEKFIPDLAVSDAEVTLGEAAEDVDDDDEDGMEALAALEDDDDMEMQAAGVGEDDAYESDTYRNLIYDDDMLDDSDLGYTFDASPDYDEEEPVGPEDDYYDTDMDGPYA